MSVVKAGAIPKLIELLKSDKWHVADQATWALGNIAGDGPTFRDIVLNLNIIDHFIRLLQNDLNVRHYIQFFD